MDQVFLPYTFLKSKISMKILITFLTIALFSFGTKAGIFHDNTVGKKGDVILEQYSSTLNKWEEVILIFGFGDDHTNCQIIQKAVLKLGKRKYRCIKMR